VVLLACAQTWPISFASIPLLRSKGNRRRLRAGYGVACCAIQTSQAFRSDAVMLHEDQTETPSTVPVVVKHTFPFGKINSPIQQPSYLLLAGDFPC